MKDIANSDNNRRTRKPEAHLAVSEFGAQVSYQQQMTSMNTSLPILTSPFHRKHHVATARLRWASPALGLIGIFLTMWPHAQIAASWDGMKYFNDSMVPPDPHGAAGPGGIIQTVNLRI